MDFFSKIVGKMIERTGGKNDWKTWLKKILKTSWKNVLTILQNRVTNNGWEMVDKMVAKQLDRLFEKPLFYKVLMHPKRLPLNGRRTIKILNLILLFCPEWVLHFCRRSLLSPSGLYICHRIGILLAFACAFYAFIASSFMLPPRRFHTRVYIL